MSEAGEAVGVRASGRPSLPAMGQFMLIGAGIAFVAGAFVGCSWRGPSWFLVAGSLVVLPLAFLAVWRVPCFGWAWVAAVLAIAMVSAVHARLRAPAAGDGRPVPARMLARLRGVVADLPLALRNRSLPEGVETRFLLDCRVGGSSGRWRPASGRVRVHVPGVARLDYGDEVEFVGWLQPLAGPVNPGAPDLRTALEAQGLSGSAWCSSAGCLRRIGVGRGSALWRAVYRLKALFRQTISRHLEPDRAAVAQCLALGDQEAMEWDLRRPFVETGTMHFLAVSGLHVATVGFFAWWVCSAVGLNRRFSAGLVAGLLVAYAFITGLRPSVMRATVGGVLVCVGQVLGRRTYWACTLAAAAVVVLLLNPLDVAAAGFGLSFLAVLGIMLLTRPVLCGLSRRREPLDALDPAPTGLFGAATGWGLERVGESLVVSTAAWAATAPVMAALFGSLTPASPITTLLMLPSMTLLLIAALPGVVLSMVWPEAGVVLLHVVDMAARATLWLGWRLQDLPGKILSVAPPVFGWVAAWYAFLGLVAFHERLGVSLRRCAVAGVALLTAAVGWQVVRPQAGPMAAVVLDVGQGHATLVRLPSGATILYGAGGHAPGRVAERVVNALHWLDRRRIDLAVVPSATAVHGNALGELADRVSVGCIVTTAAALDRPSARPAVYHAFKRGVRVITAYAGDRIVGVPGAGISVLHPPGRAELRCKLKLPDTTCALRIEAGGRSLLLAAAAGRVLGETLSRSSPTADVAIVGEWPCQGVRAAAVVANRSHRAGAAASTDQDGGVALDWSRDGLEIRGWRSHLSAWYPLSR